MAIVKKKELAEMKIEDIRKRLVELKLELSKSRAQIAVGGSAQNPGRVRELRRTIAKMLTRIKIIHKKHQEKTSPEKEKYAKRMGGKIKKLQEEVKEKLKSGKTGFGKVEDENKKGGSKTG